MKIQAKSLQTTKNELATVIKNKRILCDGCSEIKIILWFVWKYTQQNLEPHRNQSISLLCKSIDWFLHNSSLYQRYLQTDFNGLLQGIKKKKRISLVKPESYS